MSTILLAQADLLELVILFVAGVFLFKGFMRLTRWMAVRRPRTYAWSRSFAVLLGGLLFVVRRVSPSPTGSDSLLDDLVIAGFMGLASFFVWFAALSILGFLYGSILRPPVAWIRQAGDQRRANAEARSAAEQAHLQEQRERRLSATRQQQRTVCQEHRLRCELLYRSHALQLRETLPEEQFQKLLDAYLPESADPAVVDRRAAMIRQTIQECVAASGKRPKFATLEEIAATFDARRKEVAALPYDEEVKESLVAALHQQEEATIREFLQS